MKKCTEFAPSYEFKGNFGTHYSLAFSEDLVTFGLEGAVVVENITGGHPEQALLFYRGMSGIALTTAIIMSQMMGGSKKSKQAYIRKEEENSHGQKVETSSDVSDVKYCVFVDDFICSGQTLRIAWAELKREMEAKGLKLPYRIYIITQSANSGTGILEDKTVYPGDWYSLW